MMRAITFKNIIGIAIFLCLSACGGGGGGGSSGQAGNGGGVITSVASVVSSSAVSSSSMAKVEMLSGRVIDGYIKNALVFWDCNGNKLFDDGEVSVITTDGGKFSIPKSGKSQCRLIAQIYPYSIDEDTGTIVGARYQMYPLKSDQDKIGASINITPLTTLISSGAWGAEVQAENELKIQLGLSFASNKDLALSTSDPAAAHQRNVNKIIARLLQLGDSAAYSLQKDEAAQAKLIVSKASLVAKTVNDTLINVDETNQILLEAGLVNNNVYLPVNNGFVEFDNQLLSTGFTAPAQKISMLSQVQASPLPTGARTLTPDQKNYLLSLIYNDPDVQSATVLGNIVWERLQWKKLVAINSKLRQLGFYNESESEVVSIRQNRNAAFDAMNISFNAALFDSYGTKEVDTWYESLLEWIKFFAHKVWGKITWQDALKLTSNTYSVFIGETKVWYGLDYKSAVINYAHIGQKGRPKILTDKRDRMFEVAEKVFSNAECLADLSKSLIEYDNEALSSTSAENESKVVVEGVKCLSGLVSSRLIGLTADNGGKVADLVTAEDYLELSQTTLEFVNEFLGLFESNPYAVRISGALDILTSEIDAYKTGKGWADAAMEEVNLEQANIISAFDQLLDKELRISSAEETRWALRSLLVAKGAQPALVTSNCEPPNILISNVCSQPISDTAFYDINIQAVVGEKLRITAQLKSGLLPLNPSIFIDGFECNSSVSLISSFSQECVSSTVGVKDIHVIYSKKDNSILGSTTVDKVLGKVTVLSKPTNRVKPVIVSPQATVVNGNIQGQFIVQDSDSLEMRALFMDISGDAGATYTCSVQVGGYPTGLETLLVKPTSSTGCRALLIDSGKSTFKVRFSALDNTNLLSDYAYKDIGYSNLPPKIASVEVIQSSDGSIKATFTATDPENSAIGINAYLSNAGGTTFNAATKKDIGVAASGTQRTVTWSSSEAASYLTAGQTYAVRVDAFDSQSLLGQKASSNFMRNSPSNQPPSVGTVSVTQNSDGSVTATFTATDPENSTIGINAYLSNAGGATFNAATKKDIGVAASGTQRTVTWSSSEAASYLTAGQTYAVRVDAFDSQSLLGQKASSNFMRNSPSNQPPSVGTVSVTQNSDGSVTATFTATDPENSTIGINAYLSNAGGASFNAATKKILTAAASGTQRTIIWSSAEVASYLTAGQTYAVRIDAFDTDNLMGQKASSNFVRNSPSNQPPSVGTVSVTQNGDGSVTATFTATDPENSTIGINAYLSNAGGATFNAATKKDIGVAASGTQRTVTWTSSDAASYLTAGQTYVVRVDAFDSQSLLGQKASSNFVRIVPTSIPPVVSNFVINNTTSTTVIGSFTITDADNDKVKNLRVHIGKVDGGSDCLIDVGGVYGTEQVAGTKSFTGTCATPLTVAGTYYGKVEAADVKGSSAAVVKTTFTFTPDSNKAPIVSGFTINNTTSTTVTGSFTITDADNDKVKNLRVHIGKIEGGSDCFIDVGGVYGTEQVAGAKSFTGICTTPLTATGTYYGKVEAADVKGNSAAVVKTTFTYTKLDLLPIVSGFSVANTTTPTVSGSFNVTDPNGVNIKYLRVHVAKTQGGSDCQIDVDTYGSLQAGGNKNFSGNCTNLLTATGTYYAKVEAADAIGKQAVVINTSFTYTKIISLPVVSSLSVANTSTATVSGSFNVTDPNAVNIKYLRIHIAKLQGNSDCQIDVGVYGSLQPSGNKNFSGNCAGLLTASGTYYAKVEATDANGNQANVVNSPFQYTSVFSVSSFSPTTLKKGVQTTITITGVSVPSTAILTVENANCGSPYGHTSTSFKQDCNAQLTGAKTLTVKDMSGGNIVYTNSFSVTN